MLKGNNLNGAYTKMWVNLAYLTINIEFLMNVRHEKPNKVYVKGARSIDFSVSVYVYQFTAQSTIFCVFIYSRPDYGALLICVRDKHSKVTPHFQECLMKPYFAQPTLQNFTSTLLKVDKDQNILI